MSRKRIKRKKPLSRFVLNLPRYKLLMYLHDLQPRKIRMEEKQIEFPSGKFFMYVEGMVPPTSQQGRIP